MSFQPGANLYAVAVGTHPEGVEVPFISPAAPSTSSVNFPIGKRWIVPGSGEYVLVALSSAGGTLTATWTLLGTNGGPLNTLTADSGGALSPTANNINILGTANQVTTTGAGSTITLSTPATFIAPGSIASTTTVTAGTAVVATTSVTAGTTVTATLGAITATNGNLVLGTAGNKIVSSSVGTTTAAGANSFGTVTLAGGTATVATTAVTTNSIVFLTRQSIGATGAAVLGILSRGTIVNGTSFVINSLSQTDATALQASDVSVVGWMIVN